MNEDSLVYAVSPRHTVIDLMSSLRSTKLAIPFERNQSERKLTFFKFNNC